MKSDPPRPIRPKVKLFFLEKGGRGLYLEPQNFAFKKDNFFCNFFLYFWEKLFFI